METSPAFASVVKPRIICRSQVQFLTYLDLTNTGERSEEAAEEMRRYVVQQWK